MSQEQPQPVQEKELEMAGISDDAKPKEITSAETSDVNDPFVKQLIKEGEPNWLTHQYVDRPFCVLGVGFLVLFVLSGASFALGYYDLTPQHNREYLVWTDEQVIAWDKQIAGKEALLAAQGDIPLEVRIQNTPWWNPIILFKGPTEKENLLEKKHLLKIKEMIDKFQAMKDWPLFCKAASKSDSSCATEAILSPLLYLEMFAGKDWPKKTQKELDLVWNKMKDNKALWDVKQFKNFYNNEESIDKTGGVQYMRMFINFGAPLDMRTKKNVNDTEQPGVKYNDIKDRENEQKKYVADFQYEMVDLIEKFKEDNKDGIDVVIFSEAVTQQKFQELVEKDTAFAAFSIMFVLIYFVFHLESFFLAFIGVMLIGMSFSFTAFVYQGIFRIDFLANLHNLVIFIVLGIAADDIFVFMDAWRQSAFIQVYKGNFKSRISYAWRRAVRAIAVTSSTTAVAFLANTLSPMMPIQSFGIYAAIIIPANYLLIVMLFPPAVIIYERHFAKFKCCCCCPREKKNVQESNENDAEAVPNTERSAHTDVAVQQEPSKIDMFFKGPWNKFVYKARYPIIVIFIIWGIVASIFAFQIGPLSSEEEFLPKDHELQVAIDIMQDQFPGGGANAFKISLFWGVKDLDKEGGNHWDAEFIGKAIMDEEFDLSSEEAQKSLLNLCSDLRKQDFVLNERVDCWFEDFQAWVKKNKNKNLPVPPADFNKYLLEFRKTKAGEQFESDQKIGFFKDKLVFFEIESESIGDKRSAYAQKHPLYLKWQGYMDKFNEKAPKSLKSGVQTGGVFWCWMKSERAFVTSAITGMTCAIGFAFLILIGSTGNIILSIMSIVSVSIVIVSVVAIMVFFGWELGVSESIAVVIMIGLSVDYVVHLAADYKHSVKPTRYEKIEQAYSEMGISILSGTITTLGCGCALFGGKLVTFQKFAVIISSTISISFLSSMLFFGALCHVLGPENNFGDVCCCLTKKNESAEEQSQPAQDAVDPTQATGQKLNNDMA